MATATKNRKANAKPAAKADKVDLEDLLLSGDVEAAIIRQGRSESPVASEEDFPESEFAGMTYDDLCLKIRSLPPGGALLFKSGRDFEGKLASFASRIRGAIENRDKRGVNALTKKEVSIESLQAGQELVVTDEEGSKKTIQMPWNALRIRSKIGEEN